MSERDARWKRLQATSFPTTNERRIAAGYDPLDQGNDLKRTILKYSSEQARGCH